MKPDVSLVIPSKMAESFGVPGSNTNTTNTLTPTTLRTITQIFESEDCLDNLKNFDENGGFVPPPVTTTSAEFKVPRIQSFVTNSWQGGTTTVVTPIKTFSPLTAFGETQEKEEKKKMADSTRRSSRLKGRRAPRRTDGQVFLGPCSRPATGYHKMAMMDEADDDEAPSPPPAKVAKRTGGRKPAKRLEEENFSPEEEERVKTRRIRNKEAAARCRKRRVDLTNTLLKEVEGHEAKKQILEEEIQLLKGQMEELQFILEAHRTQCQLGNVTFSTTESMNATQFVKPSSNNFVAVKSEPVVVESVSAPYTIPETLDFSMERQTPKRPMSLMIPDKSSPKLVQNGVVIETPTSNLPYLAFDLVSSGLTPTGPIASIVTPIFTPTLNTPTNCSTQQRSTESSNNNNNNSPDFVSL